eukprot:1152832-Pelagomonas_calceolata.AAC.5
MFKPVGTTKINAAGPVTQGLIPILTWFLLTRSPIVPEHFQVALNFRATHACAHARTTTKQSYILTKCRCVACLAASSGRPWTHAHIHHSHMVMCLN